MEIFEKVTALTTMGTDIVMVTVVETSGSVPAKVGFKMLVTADGMEGTVGGGALENDLISRARELLESRGQAYMVKLKVSELDMQCGGEVTAFLEPFVAKADLWIFGGGHIASHLVPLASSIGFRVVVVDERPEFSDRERFPLAFKVLNISCLEGVKEIPSNSFVVILTHKHIYDQQVLLSIAGKKPPLPYVGMIGSQNKVASVFTKLEEAGIEIGNNIFSPIGLDIGGGSPMEIAVAIVAELQGVLHKKQNLPHCRLKK